MEPVVLLVLFFPNFILIAVSKLASSIQNIVFSGLDKAMSGAEKDKW